MPVIMSGKSKVNNEPPTDITPFHGIMVNNLKYSIPAIAVIVGILSVVVTVIAFAFIFSPPISKPTVTANPPTSSPASDYQPEIIPPPTDRPRPTQNATSVPTKSPVPTNTPFDLPTIVSTSQLLRLPDLTVTGMSGPLCRPDYPGTILEFTVLVRNIGRASTRTFGSFDVGVYLILGQRLYGLDKWAEKFDGVIGTSDMQGLNLNPNDDTKLTVVIDLKGNKNFGIEVVANSGENPIREADTTNNVLKKYYSMNCH